jgi:hypothetical protein
VSIVVMESWSHEKRGRAHGHRSGKSEGVVER